MIKLFEAFSGYGSQSLALKKYGINFKCVGISEIDKYAIQAHEALHGEVKNYGDISKIDVNNLPEMDLFTYSFPCQDISLAGKRKGLEKDSGTRSSLLWECEKVIEAKRPKYLMMENVKALVGKKNKSHFEEWLQVLDELGYNNYWKVINAKHCGVPQNRERVFCVSIMKSEDNGTFKFYDDFDSGVRLKDVLEDSVDEKCYLSKEAVKRLTNNFKGYHSKIRTENDIAGTLLASDHKICRGMNILACAVRGRNSNENDIRAFSPRERFRLMSVSDKDIDKILSVGISRTQLIKMAGNSIVVDCMKFLDQLGGKI